MKFIQTVFAFIREEIGVDTPFTVHDIINTGKFKASAQVLAQTIAWNVDKNIDGFCLAKLGKTNKNINRYELFEVIEEPLRKSPELPVVTLRVDLDKEAFERIEDLRKGSGLSFDEFGGRLVEFGYVVMTLSKELA